MFNTELAHLSITTMGQKGYRVIMEEVNVPSASAERLLADLVCKYGPATEDMDHDHKRVYRWNFGTYGGRVTYTAYKGAERLNNQQIIADIDEALN